MDIILFHQYLQPSVQAITDIVMADVGTAPMFYEMLFRNGKHLSPDTKLTIDIHNLRRVTYTHIPRNAIMITSETTNSLVQTLLSNSTALHSEQATNLVDNVCTLQFYLDHMDRAKKEIVEVVKGGQHDIDWFAQVITMPDGVDYVIRSDGAGAEAHCNSTDFEFVEERRCYWSVDRKLEDAIYLDRNRRG